jgi:hypothetical protein
MPRYTRQYNRKTCGPVVVANAVKWAGAKLSYRKKQKALWRECHRGCRLGSSWSGMGRALRRYGKGYLRASRWMPMRLRDFERRLANGEAAIVGFGWIFDKARGPIPKVARHVFLAHSYSRQDQTLVCQNLHPNETTSVITREVLTDWVLQYRRLRSPDDLSCWVKYVTKKETI